jgi:hypothetical protein
MTRRTLGLIGITLVLIIGLGTAIAVPAVSAETKGPAAKQALTPADQQKLQTLKALYKSIAEEAKAIREKVRTAKAAGKDLTAVAADLKTAQKYATHREVARGVMLTEAERTTLEAMQTTIRSLETTLKTQRKAKAPQATLDATRAQIKAAVSARTAYLKAIHTAALTQYSARLDTLIADANMKLAFLTNLLSRLP